MIQIKYLCILLLMLLALSGGFNLNKSELSANANPQINEWTNRLNQVLELENLSVVQYELHSQKFNAHMSYHMIIPQEYNHVDWISGILNSYGVKPTKNHPPINDTQTLQEAYTVDRNIEANSLPKYDWLIQNSQNPKGTQILTTIRSQSQMHYQMFSHALQMHQNMGPMMRDGMMNNDCPYCKNWNN